MKKTSLLIAGATMFLFACNNESKDSVQKADSANEQQRETMPENAVVDESSSSFVVDAANGGMAEVELGKLGQEKASSQKVKDFAKMMVEDHTGVNGEVKALAAKKNITLPADITQDKKDKAADLSKKTGKDFDKAYMDVMVDEHESTISMFEKKSNDVKDAEVKALIDGTLPKLKSHLDMAKTIRDGLK